MIKWSCTKQVLTGATQVSCIGSLYNFCVQGTYSTMSSAPILFSTLLVRSNLNLALVREVRRYAKLLQQSSASQKRTGTPKPSGFLAVLRLSGGKSAAIRKQNRTRREKKILNSLVGSLKSSIKLWIGSEFHSKDKEGS